MSKLDQAPKGMSFKTANLLQFGLGQGARLTEVLEQPEQFANRMGLSLGDAELAQIRRLKTDEVKDKVSGLSEGAKSFVQEVVRDGRFLIDWKDDPVSVSTKLNLPPLDPAIVNELKRIDIDDLLDPHPEAIKGIVIISIAVAVIVASSHVIEDELPIIDFSKVEKL